MTLMDHILANGVSVNNTDSLNRKIRISNLICFIVTIVMILYTPLYFFFGEVAGVIFNCIYLFSCITTYWLLHQKKYRFAFQLYINVSYLFFVATSITYGVKINLHIFLFIVCMISVSIFNKLIITRLYIFTCSFSFLGLSIWGHFNPPLIVIEGQTPTEEVFLGYFNLMLFFLIGSIFILFFKGVMIANHKNIAEQKGIIEEKNNDLLESLQYAKRIQSAMLPSKKSIENLFPDHFLFFKPKELVSGDFYWTHKHEDYIFIAVGDCTGHGVPGSMMSVLGINLLIEIVENKQITDPNQILNKLRDGILLAFDKDRSSNEYKDGMDISLVRINTKNKTYLFAGANNNVFHLSQNNIIVRKADRQSVGFSYDIRSFSQSEFRYNQGDQLVLYTDGYVDQFGGPKNKKFKLRNFKNLLTEQQHQNLGKAVEEKFHLWKSNSEQIDDVCVFGVTLN